MKTDFLVFGATGMQGGIVVRDLAERGYRVFGSSRHQDALEKVKKKHGLAGVRAADLGDIADIEKLIMTVRPRVVVNCAEGDWNLNVYKAALNGGAHIIDLGSDIPETKKQLALNRQFKQKNLTAITGCGSTPGINNVMLSFAAKLFDDIETVEAGFAWNSNIKKFVVPFSMESIIEEFTEPAPLIEKGKWKAKTPLKTVVTKKFRGVGSQKMFLVRHPEPHTFFIHCKNCGIKNVRFYAGFPAHSFKKIVSFLRGKISKKPKTVQVEGHGEVPLISLTKVLQEVHKPPAGYAETENLWVKLEGKKDGKPLRVTMECIVPTLPGWRQAGCNIDTGFPASIIAQMIHDGRIGKRGSFAPESVVPHEAFFDELRKRRMTLYMNGSRI